MANQSEQKSTSYSIQGKYLDCLFLDFVNVSSLHGFKARLVEEKSNQGCWIKMLGNLRDKLLEFQRLFCRVIFIHLLQCHTFP